MNRPFRLPSFTRPAAVALLSLAFAGHGLAAVPQLPTLGADLDGQWDGLFQNGGDSMPVTFTITSAGGKSSVLLDILEQKVQDIPVTGASREGAKVHFDVGAVDGVFDGTLTPDGAGIQGVWVQVGKRIPVTLKRRTPE